MESQRGVKFKGDGIVTFEDVPLALAADKALKAAGFAFKLVAPPPEFRLGCALGVEILLAQQEDILRLFKEKNITVSRVLPLKK